MYYIAVAVMVTVDGIVSRSSFGLGCAFSSVCILCVVHPESLGILRVEIRLGK